MRNMHHPANNDFYSLYVGSLPLDCSDEKLKGLFQQKFKSVKGVQIIRNDDGSSRGFGFIRFEDRSELQAALSEEMKIGTNKLRLDTAHSRDKCYNRRPRYSSFNSTGNNSNSNHNHHFNHNSHNHHHNQHHRHHHNNNNNNNQASIPQQPNKPPENSNQITTNTASHLPSQPTTQQLAPNSQPTSQVSSSVNTSTTTTVSSNSDVSLVNNNQNVSNIVTTTTNTNAPNSSNNMHNNNLNTSNPPSVAATAIGSDLRGYTSTATAAILDTTHILGTTDQPSMMPPTSVYGHIYPPYGPPPFGYMHHPPQPNQVIPISTVPAVQPNQASPSGGAVPLTHSGQAQMTAQNATRYNGGQQHHPHQQQQQQQHHQQQQQHHHLHQQQPHHQHHHQTQAAHADPNIASGLASIPGGVHTPRQTAAPPVYYYYPWNFDLSAGPPPASMYHTQFHTPQFIAMPSPAYMPNAHTYSQHQPQPPVAAPAASLNDATVLNTQPTATHQTQQQSATTTTTTQPLVNMRTRDTD